MLRNAPGMDSAKSMRIWVTTQFILKQLGRSCGCDSVVNHTQSTCKHMQSSAPPRQNQEGQCPLMERLHVFSDYMMIIILQPVSLERGY